MRIYESGEIICKIALPIIEIDNSQILDLAKSPKSTNSRKFKDAKLPDLQYIYIYIDTHNTYLHMIYDPSSRGNPDYIVIPPGRSKV